MPSRNSRRADPTRWVLGEVAGRSKRTLGARPRGPVLAAAPLDGDGFDEKPGNPSVATANPC
jgi:hypothetical protein